MRLKLAQCGLGIEWEETHVVTTPPSGFAGLFPATGGAIYGRASHGWLASFQRAAATTKIPGLYLAGGSAHPGPGVANGRDVGTPRSRRADGAACFDAQVPSGGYHWWYLDALSMIKNMVLPLSDL